MHAGIGVIHFASRVASRLMILTFCSTESLEQLDFSCSALSKWSHVQMHMDASAIL